MLYCSFTFDLNSVQVVVGAPSEVTEIFDDISYSKGASIVRMLHNWIGDEVEIGQICRTYSPNSMITGL